MGIHMNNKCRFTPCQVGSSEKQKSANAFASVSFPPAFPVTEFNCLFHDCFSFSVNVLLLSSTAKLPSF